jgi:SAM-dependent methyltransferase
VTFPPTDSAIVGERAPRDAGAEDTGSRGMQDAAQLRDPAVAAKYYDERYRRGYMADWPAEKCQRVAALIAQLSLPASGLALDFGCGAGVFTRVLQSALPGWEIHGTDISADAVAMAAKALPGCQFHALAECERLAGSFHLVFSHHVLEHVSDLSATAGLLERLMRPAGHMLHILPCGDAGSLEHRICMLRRDGIRPEREHRFVLDEEGHLRRLTTDRLVSLWSSDGFSLSRAFYANHSCGAVRYLTDTDLEVVLSACDPRFATGLSAAMRLSRLRAALVALWLLRKPARVVKDKLARPSKSVRDWLLLAGGLAAFPVSGAAEWLMKRLAEREWSRSNHLRGGSEMYVLLERTGR